MNNDVELIPVKGVLPSVQVQSDNVIYVPQAHKNKAGIVKEGDGVLIENGVVSLNRQTVEDMIDANKWVSYGFKQNLTEDEKGMARHNIGAGDNYFTGSYYDLTQKPHLNTNNTTGLDYGDEELNDTINLHKISKTGSFNDLKHVPQETLDFAESERQKSKNLLNIPNASSYTTNGVTLTIEDNIITLNGTTTGFTTFIRPHQLISTNVGKYAFSFKHISGTISGNRGPQSLYNQVGKNEMCYPNTSVINDITEVTDYNQLRIAISGNITFNNFKYSLQYEQGDIATDYQSYNGQITHNGDAPVVFAELERQKSKNLYDATIGEATRYSMTYSADTSKLYISGDYTDGARCQFATRSLKAGTYTLCIGFVSGTISRFSAIKFFLYKGTSWTQYAGCPDMSSSKTKVSVTFTLDEDVDDATLMLYQNVTNTMTDCVFQYQIVEGSTADFDFQAYQGGEFVQEGDIADVEHIETIYDMTSSDSNINKGFTSGIKFNDDTSTSNQINVDTTQYSHFIVTCKSQRNFYSGICNKQYTTVVGSNLYQGASVVVNNLLITDTYIRPIDCNQWISSWSSCKNNNDFVVTKIMGVK